MVSKDSFNTHGRVEGQKATASPKVAYVRFIGVVGIFANYLGFLLYLGMYVFLT